MLLVALGYEQFSKLFTLKTRQNIEMHPNESLKMTDIKLCVKIQVIFCNSRGNYEQPRKMV